MMKKIAALAALVLVLLTQRPHAQGPAARIYFVDVGTGASTLIVSPTGKTLLVDGGPPGSGAKIVSLLNTLGIGTIDFTVVTHYHIDHMGGMIEVLNAGRVAGGIAYDNGDGADVQPPGTSTSSSSTRGTYLNYINATIASGAIRQTAVPGNGIDFGDGMKATFVAAGGHFLSGGSVQITTADLNSESISTLIEYNNFDYLVSGDLTGGGSTSTAKTPDVETYVGQMVGDVDVVQLDHHGSTTGNNQMFLSALKAEVAFAQTGDNNGFGHPNRETVNRFLNTPDTAGTSFPGSGVPPTAVAPAPSTGPVFYQNEAPEAGDDRVTLQGYPGAAAGNAGHGTVLLSTDGTTTYSMSTIDPAGTGFVHTYPVDGASPGITTDFKPTVVVQTSPVVPLSTDSVVISAAVNDRESPISGVVLQYMLNGVSQAPVTMTPSGGSYQATIPPQPDGTRVDYAVSATAGSQISIYGLGYFSGVTPIGALRTLNALGEPFYNGYPARIQATVTASGFSSGTNDDYVQDVTGALNVYKSSTGPTPFTATTPGQVVEARGRVGFNGGRLRLDLTESVEKDTSPFGVAVLATNPAPAPLSTTFGAVSASPEAFEGQLVSIPGVSLVSGSSFPTAPQPLDAFVTVTDGTANFVLKLDHDTDADGFVPIGTTFTVVGIIQQDDYLRPFDSGYNLTPRSTVDLGATAPPPPPLLTIADARLDAVTNADGNPPADTIPDRLGQVVKVQGLVTSIDFRGGTGIEYYIQDATGGIDLFSTSLNAGPFAFGDSVEATGTVTQFNGLTELTVTSVSFLSAGAPPAPQTVTLSQLADGVGEALEGRLIRVNNVLKTGGTFGAAGTSNNVTISDATGTAVLRVDSDSDIDGTPTPTGVFSVTGVLGQFDGSSPFDSGYQLLPRSIGDVELSGCPIITIAGTTAGGLIGTAYSQTLTASGGTSPYTFSVVGGAVPGGLSLSPGGVLAGTPVTTGAFTFTVAAAAADNCLGVATRSVTIVSPLPVLSASPATLPFGSVAIGDSPTSSVTLSNTGTSPLVLNASAPITGADAALFQVTMPGTLTIAPGGTATATVKFTPTTAGAKTATLTITSNGGTATIALTGTGSAAASGAGIVISEFRLRGTAGGNDEFVEIYNNTDAPVNIGGFTLRGSNSAAGVSIRATVPANVALPGRAHFLFVNNNATGPYAGPVPGNVTYGTGITDDGGLALFTNNAVPGVAIDQVGLSAGSAYKEGTPLPNLGTTTASNIDRGYQRKPGGSAVVLQDINDNTADFQVTTPSNPQNLVLGPAPGSINFGGVLLPGAATQTETIKNMQLNVANSAVTLSTAMISGPDATSFAAGSFSTTALAAGASATIPVTFQPTTDGPKTAILTITTTSGAALAIPLSGTGLLGISAAPTPLEFGSVESGSTADRTVTITNGNPTDVTLTPPFSISGSAAFTVGAPAATTIAGGGTTTAVVTFHSTTLGLQSGTLTIGSTNGGTRQVALSALAVDTTPPTVTVPADITVEASGPSTTVNFTASATDLVDGPTTPACSPASGAGFPVGTTPVTCTATDAQSNTASAGFSVTVTDHSNPTLTVPADITTEATGATTSVSFAASATDTVDGAVVPVCTPASGFAFPVGTATVGCTATDAHGNSASGSFTVTVTDTHGPVVTVPANVTTEASGPTTVVSYAAATAIDAVDGAVTPVCAPASGFGFPVGTTAVNCTATDAHGNNGGGSFSVTVTDHTGPTLTLPANITANATTPSGAAVTFAASASDLVDGSRPVVCLPASGSTFAIGTTTVACSATDTHSNTSQGSFTVTVSTVPQPGRMSGDGKITVGTVTHSFTFNVQEQPNGTDLGTVSYRVKTALQGRDQEDQFVAVTVSGVTFYNLPGVTPGAGPASGVDTVTFVGTGVWNGQPGYTFEALATDAGEPGRDHDVFAITIRSTTGAIVASVNATITSGNIDSF